MTYARNFVLALLVSGLMAIPGFAQNSNSNQGNENNQGQQSSSYRGTNGNGYYNQYSHYNNSRNNNSSNDSNVRYYGHGVEHQPKAVSSAQFLRNAAQDEIGEIEVSKLAERKATDTNIRRMAQQVYSSETNNLNRLHQIAAEVHVTLPTQPTAAAKARYDELSHLYGNQFDRAFVQGAVAHHLHEIPLLREQAQSAQNPAVRNYARNGVSLEQHHLQVAENTGNNDGIHFPGNAGMMAANNPR